MDKLKFAYRVALAPILLALMYIPISLALGTITAATAKGLIIAWAVVVLFYLLSYAYFSWKGMIGMEDK